MLTESLFIRLNDVVQCDQCDSDIALSEAVLDFEVEAVEAEPGFDLEISYTPIFFCLPCWRKAAPPGAGWDIDVLTQEAGRQQAKET
jgi:hypothetical protein